MNPTHVIHVDLARVFKTAEGREPMSTLVWGDPVEVVAITGEHVEILFPEIFAGGGRIPGFIRPTAASRLEPADCVTPIATHRVLKVDFVDVQQGDACTVETPRGRLLLIDGGDNPLFARHLAGRFRGTTRDAPLAVDCILVTHGDADHFLGLAEILASEENDNPAKRIFISPRRVYHNGLVKRPSRDGGRARPELELLGATRVAGDERVIVGLERDLLAVADAEMNDPFRRWKQALRTWHQRRPLRFERLAFGDDGAARFDFLAAEDVRVDILGPIPVGAGDARGLPFLRQPRRGPRLGHDSVAADAPRGGSFSASHTINGHSVVLRLGYGDFHFLLTGDLNDESGRTLARAHNRGDLSLRAEVLKVPHHGSADFSGALLQAVAPVVSIVSSGDESARKEYIHPRATLMGALGRWSRVEEPLIFCTELAAFFEVEGLAAKVGGGPPFFAFSRTEYGLVKVRTDGARLLVCAGSGQTTLKEAYAFTLDAVGQPVPAAIRQA